MNTIKTQSPLIQVRGLVNRFAPSIHDKLDLDIYRGEILGVIGGSGSGKSVLRSIVGLRRPNAGSVEILVKICLPLIPKDVPARATFRYSQRGLCFLR